MKNIKLNEKKLNEVIKKGVILTNVFFTLTSVSACSSQKPTDWPTDFYYVSQEDNNFKDFTKTIIKNGEPTTVYYGSNIAIAINKETYEVDEYIFYKSSISGKIFDLKTEYLIVDISITTTFNNINVKNNNIILDNCYVVEFKDISDYIEGETLKEYYTLEEIKKLEPEIVESVKKINEYNKKLIKE